MPFTFTMPKLSPTMDEGTIAKWHKKEGEFVDIGEVLFEVSTDKATVEYNAIDPGWLRKILIAEGQSAVVNQPVAIFSETKDENIESYKPQGVVPAAARALAEEKKAEPTEVKLEAPRGAGLQQPAFVPEKPLEQYEFAYPTEAMEKRILASPLARKLAKEKGLDLATVKGTGPGQRIMSRDLTRAQRLAPVAFGKRQKPQKMPGTFSEEQLSPMRKVIAQRLQESKTFIPHFYVQQTIDAAPLVAMREQMQNLDIKLSYNDFVVKACALTLREHPIVNSGFNSANNSIVHYETIDLSIAVSVKGGLITPIVRHADYKNVGEISAEIRELAKRAKEGKLAPEEYKGGSFTISNLGMYGVTNFQAIINPPQGGILAVSGILDQPVVKNNSVVPGKVMNLTLSCDHRVIDGVAAAEFMQMLKKYLENPAALII